MSAKGVVTSIAFEAYPTPPWCVHRVLEALPDLPYGGSWLEPACGNGAIVDAVDNWAARQCGEVPSWVCVDLQPGMSTDANRHVAQLDYLITPIMRHLRHHVAITNPPFSIAFEFARQMTQEAQRTLLLTRLNILEAGKRSGRLDWLRANEPDVFVLPDRPCFGHKLKCSKACKGVMIAWDQPTPETINCPCGLGRAALHRTASTDATGYCWLYWPELGRKSGHITHLAETPKTERVDRVIP